MKFTEKYFNERIMQQYNPEIGWKDEDKSFELIVPLKSSVERFAFEKIDGVQRLVVFVSEPFEYIETTTKKFKWFFSNEKITMQEDTDEWIFYVDTILAPDTPTIHIFEVL